MTEKGEMNRALVALSALPRTLVHRNNTGTAWQGRRDTSPLGTWVQIKSGMVVLHDARPVSFGLVGSGDIAGVTNGVGLHVEMKSLTGRQREAQERFEQAWKRAGGLYVLAHSAEEALMGVRSASV